MLSVRFLFLSALALLPLPSRADSPWPQFRGPNGDGVVEDAQVPARFGEEQNLSWKTTVPGRGWSSPVVSDQTIWVTTAVEVEADPTEIKARMKRSGVKDREMKSRSVAQSIELKLLGYQLDNGKLSHEILLEKYDDPDAIHALNSYASPTPVIDGGNIYCHFGTYGTFCVDRQSDRVIWNYHSPIVHAVGPGSSPIIEGDLLILIHDGCKEQVVLAVDKKSGSVVWKTARPEMDAQDGDHKKAFCTPVAITDPSGQRQLICMASHYMVSYRPGDGKELWRCYHGKGFSVVPRPVYHDGVVFFSTGFSKPHLVAVRVDGEGDVSSTHVKWRQEKGMPQKPSPVLHRGLIYVIADNGVAVCLRETDGSVVWKKRIGGNFSSSPMVVGQSLLMCSQEGVVTVLSLGEEATVIGENQLDSQIMSSPAVVENSLIIRTSQSLYRFEQTNEAT